MDLAVLRGARLLRAFHAQHLEMWRHIARRWYVYVAFALTAALMAHYLGINFTNSVPERVVWFEFGATPRRGDLITFRFEATSGPAAPLSGMRWLKRVKGVPGDVITVSDRTVYVNGVLIGKAIERTPKGSVLRTVAPGVIPPGHYFIGGSSNDSLDSRYGEIGLVRSDQLIARAHPIL